MQHHQDVELPHDESMFLQLARLVSPSKSLWQKQGRYLVQKWNDKTHTKIYAPAKIKPPYFEFQLLQQAMMSKFPGKEKQRSPSCSSATFIIKVTVKLIERKGIKKKNGNTNAANLVAESHIASYFSIIAQFIQQKNGWNWEDVRNPKKMFQRQNTNSLLIQLLITCILPILQKDNLMNPAQGFIFLFFGLNSFSSSYLPNTIRDPRAMMVKLFHTSLACGAVLGSNRPYYLKRRNWENSLKLLKTATQSFICI